MGLLLARANFLGLLPRLRRGPILRRESMVTYLRGMEGFSPKRKLMKRLTVGPITVGVAIITMALSAYAEAQLEAPHRAGVDPGSERSAQLASRAAEAEVAGNHALALKLADEGIRADANDPWPYYNRACALAGLKRVDEAVASYQQA